MGVLRPSCRQAAINLVITLVKFWAIFSQKSNSIHSTGLFRNVFYTFFLNVCECLKEERDFYLTHHIFNLLCHFIIEIEIGWCLYKISNVETSDTMYVMEEKFITEKNKEKGRKHYTIFSFDNS